MSYDFELAVMDFGPIRYEEGHALVPATIRIKYKGAVTEPKERDAIMLAALPLIVEEIKKLPLEDSDG